MSFFEKIKPFFTENLHEVLQRQLRSHAGIKLLSPMAHALGNGCEMWKGNFKSTNPELIESIKEDIHAAMDDKHCFVKVGAKAPTDCPEAVKNRGKAKNAQQALYYLTHSAQKIPNELHLALANQYDPWLWVFVWGNVPPGSEFRVFVKDTSIPEDSGDENLRPDEELFVDSLAVVGISQRNYLGTFPDIHKYHFGLLQGIAQYVHEKVIPYLPGEAAVDLMTFITEDDQRLKLQLIDINPLIKSTDLCLFDPKYETKEMKEPNFDGTFRYLKDGKPVAVGVK